MKNYYINAEIAEEMPSYTFVLKANSNQEARERATQILNDDYPQYFAKFSVQEVTAEDLLEIMTLE